MVLPCFSGDICRYGFLGHQASILCESLPAYRNPSVPRQPHTGNRKEASIQPLPCRSCNGISGSPWIKRMRSLPEGPHPSCPAQGSSPWHSGLFPYPSHTFMSGHIPTEETRTPGLTSFHINASLFLFHHYASCRGAFAFLFSCFPKSFIPASNLTESTSTSFLAALSQFCFLSSI